MTMYEFTADLPPELVNDLRAGELVRIVYRDISENEDGTYTVLYVMRPERRKDEVEA